MADDMEIDGKKQKPLAPFAHLAPDPLDYQAGWEKAQESCGKEKLPQGKVFSTFYYNCCVYYCVQFYSLV